MDSYFAFLALAAGAAIIGMTVKSAHREMGNVFSMACGAALLVMLCGKLTETVVVFQELAALADMESGRTEVIFKVLGVSLLCEAAAQMCRDAGEEGIALRVELGGKVMLLSMSLPLVQEITGMILGLTQ